MRDPRGQLTVGPFRSFELRDSSANSLQKRFDIDDNSIGRQVPLVCSRRTIPPLIKDWAGIARGA